MERTPEEALKILAYRYNERILTSHYKHQFSPWAGEVDVKHIRTKQNVEIMKDDSGNLIRSYLGSWKKKCSNEYWVRVSSVEPTTYQQEGDVVQELKWEGLLQDWFQACAEVIKEMSKERIEG